MGRLTAPQTNTEGQARGRLASALPPVVPTVRKPIQAGNVLNKVGGFLGVKNYGESLGQAIAQPFVRSKVAEANAVTQDQTQRIKGLMSQSQDPSRYKRALELVSDTQKMFSPKIQEITPVLKKNNRQLVGEAISAGTAIGGGALGANVAQQGVRSVRAGAGILKTITPAVATGTAGGALAGLGTGLEQKDATPQSVAKSVAINAAVGAGATGLLSAGAQGVGRLASKYITKAPVQEVASMVDNVSQNVDNVASNNIPEVPVKTPTVSKKVKQSTVSDQELVAKLRPDMQESFYKGTQEEQKRALEHLRLKSEIERSQPLIQEKVSTARTTTNDTTSELVSGRLQPIQSTSTTKVRGLSRGVEAKAIENKLVDTFGELPEYQTVNMAEQAQKASDLLSSDYARAKRIAMGQELAPNDVIPESVFTAVENQAIKNGDVETLRQLATQSNLSSEATTMGQRIRALAERNPDSPINAIQKVQAYREQRAMSKLGGKSIKQAKSEVVNQIKNEIKKAAPKKQDWGSFIESITC